MATPETKRSKTGQPAWKHDRPGSSNVCGSKSYKVVSLGHSYRTDVLEVRLNSPASYSDYQSALQALLAALPEIGIKSDDVKGMLRSLGRDVTPGILFVDSVPGGAGHAHHIRRDLEQLISAAHRNVSECSCGLDSSCYGCLRSYANQRIQDRLTRQGALMVLQQYVPE